MKFLFHDEAVSVTKFPYNTSTYGRNEWMNDALHSEFNFIGCHYPGPFSPLRINQPRNQLTPPTKKIIYILLIIFKLQYDSTTFFTICSRYFIIISLHSFLENTTGGFYDSYPYSSIIYLRPSWFHEHCWTIQISLKN